MNPRHVSLEGFRGWGWLAPACAVLLLAAAALHWGVSPKWQAQAQAAFSQAAASAQPARIAAAARPLVSSDEVLAALPSEAGLAARLSDLLSAAGPRNLRLGDADVSNPSNDLAGVVRWRVAMPVQGRYADLRSFLQAALAADPSLSLDQLRVVRTQADNPEVQAELVWSLHARKASARLP